jgi:competence protein ComEC
MNFLSIAAPLTLLLLLMTSSPADLTVRFLDVGEGDGVLLQSEGKTMLIDGGTKDSGNLTRVYLQSLNISSLDMVMVTGPAPGRTGALLTIMNSTPADSFLHGGWNSLEQPYQDVLTRIQENNTPVTVVSAGDRIEFTDEVTIDLLTPANKTWESASDTLVPKISCGDVKILLLGDDPVVSGDVRAQIVRVADHGSREGTDAAFIHQVSPEVAVISTGPNTMGNPVESTVNTLENNGASVLRTDADGVITITTDGKKYTVGKLRMEPEMTISLVSVVETKAPSHV